MNGPTLSIRGLEVTFTSGGRMIDALRGVDLDVHEGTIHGLVGESGSGKSVTSRSVLGLLPPNATRVSADRMNFEDRDLGEMTEETLRTIRGAEIAMIFQEPGKHLDPAFRIGFQIAEVIRAHKKVARRRAEDETRELLDLVGLGNDERARFSYPHELSGGMKQRAMIAMALSCQPRLLIADEPTTALDVTVQRRILDLFRTINSRLRMALLFISHDLGVIESIADYVSVIYAGKIIESAPRAEMFDDPKHPYTKLLLDAIPDPSMRGKRLTAIPGTVPDAESTPSGCAFHPRCPFAEEVCTKEIPAWKPVSKDHFAACHLIGTHDLIVEGVGRSR
jgi:oligopeptide/dipeptide ABC transporter ATP-binding protein